MSVAFLVVGLGFGDEGKGSVVDYLVRKHEAKLVVRFNGGAQAAHNVQTPDGRHHTFSQFGSGTFVPGVRTHLSRHVLLNPRSLLREEAHLRRVGVPDALERLTIDPRAIVTTSVHIAANRIREELRGNARHGSCGMGIGETMRSASLWPELILQARDLLEPEAVLQTKLDALAEIYKRELIASDSGVVLGNLLWREELEYYAAELHAIGKRLRLVEDEAVVKEIHQDGLVTVCEGAQGVLLDEVYGFPPHQTYSTCTFENALAFFGAEPPPMRKIGVIRSYATRHGAGPFPTELPYGPKDEHNGTHDYQGAFRVGALDLTLLEYAIRASRPTELAVTHLDRFSARFAAGYVYPSDATERIEFLAETTRERQTRMSKLLGEVKPAYATGPDNQGPFLGMLERMLELPIRIRSSGKTAADKGER